MADVTKDIWNDDDGVEAAKPKKRTGLRRFLVFLLILVAVLAVVLVRLGGSSGMNMSCISLRQGWW